MPRGKRKNANLSIDEQIALAEKELQEITTARNEKTAQLKALKKKKDELEAQRVMAAIRKSGKTVDEAIALIEA